MTLAFRCPTLFDSRLLSLSISLSLSSSLSRSLSLSLSLFLARALSLSLFLSRIRSLSLSLALSRSLSRSLSHYLSLALSLSFSLSLSFALALFLTLSHALTLFLSHIHIHTHTHTHTHSHTNKHSSVHTHIHASSRNYDHRLSCQHPVSFIAKNVHRNNLAASSISFDYCRECLSFGPRPVASSASRDRDDDVIIIARYGPRYRPCNPSIPSSLYPSIRSFVCPFVRHPDSPCFRLSVRPSVLLHSFLHPVVRCASLGMFFPSVGSSCPSDHPSSCPPSFCLFVRLFVCPSVRSFLLIPSVHPIRLSIVHPPRPLVQYSIHQ